LFSTNKNHDRLAIGPMLSLCSVQTLTAKTINQTIKARAVILL